MINPPLLVPMMISVKLATNYWWRAIPNGKSLRCPLSCCLPLLNMQMHLIIESLWFSIKKVYQKKLKQKCPNQPRSSHPSCLVLSLLWYIYWYHERLINDFKCEKWRCSTQSRLSLSKHTYDDLPHEYKWVGVCLKIIFSKLHVITRELVFPSSHPLGWIWLAYQYCQQLPHFRLSRSLDVYLCSLAGPTQMIIES